MQIYSNDVWWIIKISVAANNGIYTAPIRMSATARLAKSKLDRDCKCFVRFMTMITNTFIITARRDAIDAMTTKIQERTSLFTSQLNFSECGQV